MNTTQKNNKQEDELDLSNLLSDLIAKWHYFVITGFILAALTVVYIKISLPVYQSSSSVLIDDSKSSNNFEDILSSDLFGTSMSLPTEIGILTSRTVIQKTIEELHLRVQYFNTTSFPARPIYPNSPFLVEVNDINKYIQDLTFDVKVIDAAHLHVTTEYTGDDLPAFSFDKNIALGESIGCKYFNFTIHKSDSVSLPEAGSAFEFKVRNINKLTNEIIDNLKAEPLDKDANIVILTYQDVVPLRALDVLNSICKVYIDLDVQDKASVAGLTLKFVDEQLTSTGNALSSTEHEMQDFKEKNKTVNLSEESKSMLQKLNDLDVERVKSNIDITALDNLFNYVTKNQDLTNMAPSSMGIPDPLLVELITNYQTLQAKRKGSSYGVKNDAPVVKVLDQQLAETRSALIENIRSIQKRLTVTRNSIQQQLAQYEAEVKQVPEIERQFIGIQRNVEVNQNIYTYLLQKKAETSIAKATAVSDNRILDQASLAEDPVSPNKKLLAVLLVLFTGLIPGGIILSRILFKSKIQSREDISRITSVPVLGVVGHSPEKTNLAVFNRPKSAISEAFRTIRTNLQFYGLNAGNKVITITSSVGGEGKSFVTLNLATVLALQGKKVVMIGLDLRKPRLFDDLEIKNDIGASNYLVGASTLDQVIRSTKVPGLDFISAGPIPPNPAELLSKKLMTDMIDELKTRYDFVVIDTPPLGVVSDAFIIMRLSDINLYIVRQGYSRMEFIRSLDELYREGKFSSLSIILNDSDFSRSYGYGHTYGYIKGNAEYYEEVVPSKWSMGNWFKRN